MSLFEYTTDLACSPRSLYEFLLRPKNVELISTPNAGLRFVSAPEVVEVGSKVTFEINSFGRVNRGAHEIIELLHSEKIVEKQVEGAMREWLHTHTFVATNNGVHMVDRIEFLKPGGVLGFIVTEEKILDMLEDGYFYRQQQLEKIVSSGELS
ncbi:MAG: hypothetical protein R3C01_17665 [Planctomycetaceae bacterium]